MPNNRGWEAVPAGVRIVEIAAVAFKHGLDWGSALLFITTLKFVNLLNLQFVRKLAKLAVCVCSLL